VTVLVVTFVLVHSSRAEVAEHALLPVMADELALSMEKLVSPDGTKPYFLQYSVTDTKNTSVAATLGAIHYDSDTHQRVLDVDVRCGDYSLDNTRQIRGSFGSSYDTGGGVARLPVTDDLLAARQAIWLKTDEQFKSAAKRLAQVQANLKVKVEEEDPSDDFSREEPSVGIEPWLSHAVDQEVWRQRIRAHSQRFREHPLIYNSQVSLSVQTVNRLSVNSEGSRIQFGQSWWRISISAGTVAEDGMELSQQTSFDAHTPTGLPDDKTVAEAVDQVIEEVLALRAAPIVDPYTGPAILENRAAAVFFHEIFGHRIEGHRQKDVDEGQTFAKKLNESILPDFLSVVDDPSQRTFRGQDLNGYYPFDEECVPGQASRLVEDGVLRTFLMSRTPARGITKSDGHGRRRPGQRVVSRQGNLFIQSSQEVPYDELRARLIEECKRQDKEYGLLFRDISGGFTTTRVRGPQAFKVLPILVYRVYADGRPDELVRGVDIVGTPLTCFSRILSTADDPAVFNGYCGAESGSIPVSAIAPSLLVEQIEIEKKQKAQNRPPILPAPIAPPVEEDVEIAGMQGKS
jgi:predicted Zn-dependent protease